MFDPVADMISWIEKLTQAERLDMDAIREARAELASLRQALAVAAQEKGASVPQPTPPARSPEQPRRPREAPIAPALQLQLDDLLRHTKALGVPSLTVEQRGTWLWLAGDTRAHADGLKALGYHYDAKKTAARADGLGVWYVPDPNGPRKRRRGSSSEGQIVAKYGRRVLLDDA